MTKLPYQVGDKVRIKLKVMTHENHSIHVHPSSEFLKKIANYKDEVGVVQRLFPPWIRNERPV
jgi:hypothetical protein